MTDDLTDPAYRVRGVGGSCAEHLTVESYTIIISLQSYFTPKAGTESIQPGARGVRDKSWEEVCYSSSSCLAFVALYSSLFTKEASMKYNATK